MGRKQTALASRGTKAMATAAAGTRATSKTQPPVAAIMRKQQRLLSTGQLLSLLLVGTLALGAMAA